ncbi:hypothetical protein [Micromonospora sp. NPDC005197]|uniref:hypothetical protein n=1 Tax=unclassified Micromonospora TaxID=2617518 RepID=UPI0033AE4395
MASCLFEASVDLAHLLPDPPDPVELYNRFMGFARQFVIGTPRRPGRRKWFEP